MRIRLARLSEAPLAARHRALMFQEMGRLAEDAVGGFIARATLPIERALADGSFRLWFAEEPEGAVVAGGGLLLRPLMPRPEAMQSLEAIVLNMYVEPAFRRQGIARRLMAVILDWCRESNVGRIVLHPSVSGKPLYEALGFVPTGEMVYRPQPAGE